MIRIRTSFIMQIFCMCLFSYRGQKIYMLVACLLALAFSLQISCSIRPRPSLRSSSRKNSTTPPSFPGNYENIDFKAACIELSREIKALAMSQLGLSGSSSRINFSDYEIQNWPEFVPLHLKNWDEKAVEELRAALPTLSFKPLASTGYRQSPSENSAEIRIINRRKLLDKLVLLFNQQTGLSVKRVPWSQYHLNNWPVGVGLRADRWNAAEVLAISRHLDRIRFVIIKGDQVRTITYTDGKSITVDSKHNPIDPHGRTRRRRRSSIGRKRRSSTFESDEESESSYSESESDESEPEKENVSSDSEVYQSENISSSSANKNLDDNLDDNYEFAIGIDENEGIPDTVITKPVAKPVVVVEDEDAALRQYDPNLDNFYDSQFDHFLALFKK